MSNLVPPDALFSRAVESSCGHRVGVHANVAEWILCPEQCPNPFVVSVHKRRLPALLHRWLIDGPDVVCEPKYLCPSDPFEWLVRLHLPCKQCAACADRIHRQWIARSLIEYQAATESGRRTWFGTFTIAPEWIEAPARQRVIEESLMVAAAGDLDRFEQIAAPNASERFQEELSLVKREFTLYLKRLRKAGFAIRYVMCTEYHKTGRPHLHALLHAAASLQERRLRLEWPCGFASLRLARGASEAMYVAKYVAKLPGARVRASLGYGRRIDASSDIEAAPFPDLGECASASCVTETTPLPAPLGAGEGSMPSPAPAVLARGTAL